MKMIRIIAIAAVIASACWLAFRSAHGNGETAVSYETVEITHERMEVSIESTGIVEPRNRIEIMSPIAGRVEEVLVTEGQTVKQGEVIARISSTERATLLDAARAKGDEVFQKWQDVYKPTPLMAPLDGTIIARSKEPGQTVTASDAILVLSDRLVITAQVDETDIGQVRTGLTARITLDAYPDVDVDAVVRHIAYEAQTVNNVTIYEVEVEPESIPERMKSGMTATVAFLVAHADDTMTVSADAVSEEDGMSYVLVDSGAPSGPEQWRVLTGLSSGSRVEILAGLEGHEQVVKTSYRPTVNEEQGSSPFMPSRKK